MDQKPPTLNEIREALRAFGGLAARAREVFQPSRLQFDPGGKGWSWDVLRRRVQTSIEAMETGKWLSDDVEIYTNDADALDAVRLYEALGKATAAAGFLVYGAETLPGEPILAQDSPFCVDVLAHREVLKALRERMESMDETDSPSLAMSGES